MPRLTEDMLTGLPHPVQRLLLGSGVVGRDIPRTVTVRQVGRIRTSADSKWLNFTARETYSVDKPGFQWDARFKIGAIPAGRATDSLQDGRGKMHVKLLGMFTVVDAAGPELDQGALMRWLNETMWFPAVWATDVIDWESVDDNTARASVTDGQLTVSAGFHFDDDGRLIDFTADRYRDVGDGFELASWSTPLRAHAVYNGIELPSEGSGVWNLDEGDFEYIQLRLRDVIYT